MQAHVSPRRSRSTALLMAAVGALLAGAGTARAQPAVVNGNTLVQTVPCGDSDATVNGSGNRIAFTGTCRGLSVDGNDNRVQIDLVPGARIAVAGHGNHVAYTRPPSGGGPNVALDGVDNEVVARAEPPAGALVAVTPLETPPMAVAPISRPEAPLLLAADNDRETVDCAGRDVLIRGSASHYRLLGGCRSITDEGRDNLIEARLQPGAHVVIGGPGVTMRYSLLAPGPSPVIAVTASGSFATEVGRFADDSAPVILAAPR